MEQTRAEQQTACIRIRLQQGDPEAEKRRLMMYRSLTRSLELQRMMDVQGILTGQQKMLHGKR